MLVRIGRLIGRGTSGTRAATIILDDNTIAEDASVGDLVGNLSVENGSGSYTFSITADPDSKFQIDGSRLETSATLDYGTATSHSVTIQATNGVDPISRTFTINVTEVGGGTAGQPIGLLLLLTKAA